MKMPDTYTVSLVLLGVSALLCLMTSSSQATSCSNVLPDNLNCSEKTDYLSCRCLPGYELTGSTSVAICFESGDDWVGDYPNCTAVQCPEPPIPAGSIVNVTRGTTYYIGDVISYTCKSGYEAEGETLRSCQENGTWTELDFYCNATCSTGNSLRYQNDVCFELSDNSLKWAEAKTECERLNSTLAKIASSDQQSFLEERLKSISGVDRYWIGGQESKAWIWDHSRTSITFFPWAPYEPNDDTSNEDCIQLSNLPTTDDSQKHNYRWNDNACNKDATDSYQHSALCQFDNPCPIDTLTADRQVNYTNQCLVFKLGRYTWNGANDYCSNNGGWLVEVIDQEMQDFLVHYLLEQFPNELTNWWTGAITDTSVTDRVWRWTDYELITSPSWLLNEPSSDSEKCIEMINPGYKWNDENCESTLKYICYTDLFDSCGYPGNPSHGQRLGAAEGAFNIDDVVEFECDDGYDLEGSSTRTCLSNGRWSGEVTTCKIVSCDDTPDPPQHGNVTVLSNEYRGVAILSCADGYVLQGEAIAVCSSNATWSIVNSSCVYDALPSSTTHMTEATSATTVMEKTTLTITSGTTQHINTVTSSTTKLASTAVHVTTKPTITATSGTTQSINTVTLSTAKPASTAADHVTTKPTITAASGTTQPINTVTSSTTKPGSPSGTTKLSTQTITVMTAVPSTTTSRGAITTDTVTTSGTNKDDPTSTFGANGVIIAVGCISGFILLVLLIVICCWCRSCRHKERHFERVLATGNKPMNGHISQTEVGNQAYEPSAVSNDYNVSGYSYPMEIGNAYQSIPPAYERMASQERPLVDEIELENSYDVLDRGPNHLPGKGELFVLPKINESEQFSYAKVELNRGFSVLSNTSYQT